MVKDFEQLEHTADLQIKVYGSTLTELFKNSLNGMFQMMHPNSSHCVYNNNRITCSALTRIRTVGANSPDLNALLVDFLSYALYLSDIHNEAYFDVTFTIFTSQSVVGDLHGVPVTGFNQSEVKAVTYHNLNIVQHEGLWQTHIVFDI